MALVGFLVLALLGVPSLAQAMSPQSLEPAAVRAEHRIEEQAESRVSICYNYGCVREEEVRFRAATLTRLVARFAVAQTAEEERAVLGEALGRLYRVAAIQTPIAADRGGNLLDDGANGRMDCIDHSTSSTRLLRLLEARGALRFHRVLEPVRRTRFIFQHFSAAIEELSCAERSARVAPERAPSEVSAEVPSDVSTEALAHDPCAEAGLIIEDAGSADAASPGARYVVDSWFVDNGEPAVVLPLAEWLNGEGPNVQ